MYGVANYDAAAAFVSGWDFASDLGLLTGFREWLIVRLGTGNNLHWSALVLHVAFPKDADAQAAATRSAKAQRHAVDTLFKLIDEFDQVKSTGLGKVFIAYEKLSARRKWNAHSSRSSRNEVPR
jgi:hypothetical protein